MTSNTQPTPLPRFSNPLDVSKAPVIEAVSATVTIFFALTGTQEARVKFRFALFGLSFLLLLAALSPLLHFATAARAQLSTGKAPAESIASHGYIIASKPIKGSAIPADYTFVLTRDEVYVPIIVRKPQGDGPFPAITMGSGEGREGMHKVEDLAERLSQMQDRMLARGYVVATVNYRNEIPYAYEQSKPPQNLPDSISGERRMLKSGPTLDHEDLIAILRYLQSLPYVDKNVVGAMGVSHSGEMIMKASSEFTFGAGVCIEPADHEFLTVNTGPSAPRKGTEIQYNDIEVARKNAPAGHLQVNLRMDEGSRQRRAMAKLRPSHPRLRVHLQPA
jgi:dienelactone hydrolase